MQRPDERAIVASARIQVKEGHHGMQLSSPMPGRVYSDILSGLVGNRAESGGIGSALREWGLEASEAGEEAGVCKCLLLLTRPAVLSRSNGLVP